MATSETAPADVGELRERIARLERARRLTIARALEREPWEPYDHQIPPPELAVSKYLWLMLAGRGAGKTDGCASYFDRFMRGHDGARGGIVAPTLGDAVEACVYGPSGLVAHNPKVKLRQRAGGTHVVWPNGSEAKLFGAYTREDIERLRAGGNRHLYWAEELAAWRNLEKAWENMELGLRLGRYPHIIASTTPKTRPKLRELMLSKDTVMTTASILDNPRLPKVQRDRLLAKYKGTRLEAQELRGEYLEDVEGALWTYEIIHAHRVFQHEVPDLVRVVVGVDPSGGEDAANAEQGIVVCGRGVDGDAYVLADRSCKLSPDGWGRRAVQAYADFAADRILGETNFGGDMVIFVVKTAANAMGVEVATKKITASRGKVARAEPISALYEQGRVHHVMPDDALAENPLELLEGQMRSWVPDSGESPDRLDANVWALTELMITGRDGRTGTTSIPRGEYPTRIVRRN